MSKSVCRFLLCTVSFLALNACGPNVSVHAGKDTSGGSGGSSTTNSSESYSYSFEYNGCNTGTQVADSQLGYCQNLANDALNHHCAQWMPKDAFDKSHCTDSGVTWDATAGLDSDGIPSPAEDTEDTE